MGTIGGDTWTEITFDGDNIAEVTVDGDIVWDGGGSVPDPTVIDSFEDQDLSEYTEQNATGTWTFTQSPARSGYALQVEHSGSGDPYQYSSSGLNAYPQQGDRISYWLNMSEVESRPLRAEMWFCTEDSDNYYTARVDTEFDVIFNSTVVGGTQTSNDGGSYSGWTNDTWYNIRVEWDDGSTFGQSAGDIRTTLRDADGNQLAQTGWIGDTTYDGTGAGQGIRIGGKPNPDGSTTSQIRFDDLEILNR